MCTNRYEDFPLPKGNSHTSNWRVEREKSTQYGRLDLVVSNPKLSFLLVIENKIYAPEQADQLLRYAQWLSDQQPYFERQALIYLTPGGNHSNSAGGYPYYPFSYRQDIYHWLNHVQADIQSPRVQESIKQYMEIIARL